MQRDFEGGVELAETCGDISRAAGFRGAARFRGNTVVFRNTVVFSRVYKHACIMGQFYGVETMIPPYGYQLIIKLISNNVMHAIDIVIINSVHVYNLV